MKDMITQKDEQLLNKVTDDILDTTPIVSDYYSRDSVYEIVYRCYELCKQNNMIETRSIGMLGYI